MKSVIALSALAAAATAAPQRAGPVALVNPVQVALDGFSEDVNQDGFVDPIAPAVAAPALAAPWGYAAGPGLWGYGKREAEAEPQWLIPGYAGPLNLAVPHGALGAVLHPNGAVAPPYTPDQQLALAEKAKILAERGQLIKREAEADPQVLLGGGLLGAAPGLLAAPAVATVAVPTVQHVQYTQHVPVSRTHTETIPLGVQRRVISTPLIKREADSEAEAEAEADPQLLLGGGLLAGPGLLATGIAPTYTLGGGVLAAPAIAVAPEVAVEEAAAPVEAEAAVEVAEVAAPALPAITYAAPGLVGAPGLLAPGIAAAPGITYTAAPAIAAAQAPAIVAPAPAIATVAVPTVQHVQYTQHVPVSKTYTQTIDLGVQRRVISSPLIAGAHIAGVPGVVAAVAPAAAVVEEAAAVVEE